MFLFVDIYLEVENFLTDEECQLIIKVATEAGFEESKVVRTSEMRQSIPKLLQLFKKNDLNSDKYLNNAEVWKTF